MTIDVSERGSPGWWLQRLYDKLSARRGRVIFVRSYLSGNCPLPEGAQNCREAYREFQKKSRTNYATLVDESITERMVPTGFRTGAQGDDLGDTVARRIWNANNLDVYARDVHDDMIGVGDGYTMVGPPDTAGGMPVITAEDPECVITEQHPLRPSRSLAGLKLIADDVAQRGYAYLHLPGLVWVASGPIPEGTDGAFDFSPSAWQWEPDLSTDLVHEFGDVFADVVSLVRFRNRKGVGEIEPHVDVLDRINYVTLQRLVIMAMQAYKQRATKGDLPEIDEEGNPIDYSEVFRPGPGALWQLPDGVDLWESGVTDLSPVLAATKDDVRHLAAVTRTPVTTMLPDGANQTAEGAAMAREGLIFKVGDRIRRATHGWNQTMSLAFLYAGDVERAQILDLETLWAPPERLTLSERADAASKAKDDYPWRSRMTQIWGESPEAVARMEAERTADALLTASFAPAPAVAAAPSQRVTDDASVA